jgi:hypothetical protein
MGHSLAVGQQLEHQVGEVQAFVVGDVVQNAGGKDIDAHADQVFQGGLFDVAGDGVVGVGFDHAQVDVHFPVVGGDGGQGISLAFMEGHQVGNIEQGQHVAVRDDEGVVQAVDQRDGPSGPQGVVLVAVADLQAVVAPVFEEGAHQPGQVPDGDDDLRRRQRV